MTVSRDGQHLICDEPGCRAALRNHRWSKTRDGAAWFFTKDGKHYCPNHLPAWVPAWRAAKKRNR